MEVATQCVQTDLTFDSRDTIDVLRRGQTHLQLNVVQQQPQQQQHNNKHAKPAHPFEHQHPHQHGAQQREVVLATEVHPSRPLNPFKRRRPDLVDDLDDAELQHQQPRRANNAFEVKGVPSKRQRSQTVDCRDAVKRTRFVGSYAEAEDDEQEDGELVDQRSNEPKLHSRHEPASNRDRGRDRERNAGHGDVRKERRSASRGRGMHSKSKSKERSRPSSKPSVVEPARLRSDKPVPTSNATKSDVPKNGKPNLPADVVIPCKVEMQRLNETQVTRLIQGVTVQTRAEPNNVNGTVPENRTVTAQPNENHHPHEHSRRHSHKKKRRSREKSESNVWQVANDAGLSKKFERLFGSPTTDDSDKATDAVKTSFNLFSTPIASVAAQIFSRNDGRAEKTVVPAATTTATTTSNKFTSPTDNTLDPLSVSTPAESSKSLPTAAAIATTTAASATAPAAAPVPQPPKDPPPKSPTPPPPPPSALLPEPSKPEETPRKAQPDPESNTIDESVVQELSMDVDYDLTSRHDPQQQSTAIIELFDALETPRKTEPMATFAAIPDNGSLITKLQPPAGAKVEQGESSTAAKQTAEPVKPKPKPKTRLSDQSFLREMLATESLDESSINATVIHFDTIPESQQSTASADHIDERPENQSVRDLSSLSAFCAPADLDTSTSTTATLAADDVAAATAVRDLLDALGRTPQHLPAADAAAVKLVQSPSVSGQLGEDEMLAREMQQLNNSANVSANGNEQLNASGERRARNTTTSRRSYYVQEITENPNVSNGTTQHNESGGAAGGDAEAAADVVVVMMRKKRPRSKKPTEN